MGACLRSQFFSFRRLQPTDRTSRLGELTLTHPSDGQVLVHVSTKLPSHLKSTLLGRVDAVHPHEFERGMCTEKARFKFAGRFLYNRYTRTVSMAVPKMHTSLTSEQRRDETSRLALSRATS